jgi:hypothetical protein
MRVDGEKPRAILRAPRSETGNGGASRNLGKTRVKIEVDGRKPMAILPAPSIRVRGNA